MSPQHYFFMMESATINTGLVYSLTVFSYAGSYGGSNFKFLRNSYCTVFYVYPLIPINKSCYLCIIYSLARLFLVS